VRVIIVFHFVLSIFREYGDGEYFTYSYGLVFTSRLGGLILSIVLMKVNSVPWTPPGKLYEFAFPSVSNMLSSWCQYEALRFAKIMFFLRCDFLLPLLCSIIKLGM